MHTINTIIQDTVLSSGRHIDHIDVEVRVGFNPAHHSNDPGWASCAEAWVEGKIVILNDPRFTEAEVAECQAIIEKIAEEDPEEVGFWIHGE